MKILTLSDVYFPRINGVSTSIATFHREFAACGHETLLIAPHYGGESRPEPGILRIPARRVPFDPEDRMMTTRAIYQEALRLRSGGFDVLHVQTPFLAHRSGLKLGRLLGLPVIESYHTYFEEYLSHYVPFAPRALMRLIARRFSRAQCHQVNCVVVPSTAMEETLRSYGVRTRIERIPTGLRMEEFAGADGARFRRRFGIAPERPTLVYVGRIAFEKNVGFLLRVLAEVRKVVPEVLLIFAGDGPAQPPLEQLAQRRGLSENILFAGYQTYGPELWDCYRAGDVFVFASRTETQGLVLLEAMALKVPVVSTAVMGTREVLAPGKGALIAEENVGDFTRKVLFLLRHSGVRRFFGAAARQYAERWSAPAMADRMLELYHELIDDASRRARGSVPRRVPLQAGDGCSRLLLPEGEGMLPPYFP